MAALHRSRPWWTHLVYTFCAVSAVGFLALAEFDVIPSMRWGFDCNDPSLSFPFHGDSVSMGTVIITTFVAPPIVMWIVESLGRRPQDFVETDSTKKRAAVAARVTALWYREYLVGFGLAAVVTEFMKMLLGTPRPHFFHTCQPDTARNCTSGFITNYICTNPNNYRSWDVTDSRKSFPSGHASVSVYTAFFLMWFLQQRLVNSPWLLVPWLQSMCLLWGLVCSLTRITDHRHHWWDVLAGSVIGIVIAVYMVMVHCRRFTELPPLLTNDLLVKEEIGTHENSNMANAFRSTRYQSVKRLLSSTSSCTGVVTSGEQEMKEAA